MKYLDPTLTYGIVGDIHQQIPTLWKLITAHQSKIDHWIFLGDWFDDFTPEANIHDTLEALSLLSTDVNATCIWGNHDLSYRWEWAQCSGWSWVKQAIIEASNIKWDGFHLGAIIELAGQDSWVFTHAGISNEWYTVSPNLYDLTRDLSEAEQSIRNGVPHPWLLAGYDRGGSQKIGGCLWQDWGSHVPIKGIRQVVGHTPVFTSRGFGEDWCIDTRLAEFGIWKHGELEIIKA